MLKPAERTDEDEKPIGELVQQLVDDGKAYARAEIDVAKAMATAKAKQAAVPAAMVGGAFLLAQAAAVMLAFALFGAIYTIVGPVVAGILTAAVFVGAAYLLVRAAQRRFGAGS